MTGRSTIELARSFGIFKSQSDQALGPALAQFKSLAEASKITGASIEDLSRAAAAAVNNMRVPAEEMDDLIKKWSVELPASMIQPFAEVAPRLMEAMEAVGFSGKRNAEEIAVAFSEMNRSLGSPRLAFSTMNHLLGEMSDGTSRLGRIMVPVMQDVKAHGGGMLEVFDGLWKTMDKMGAFQPIEFILRDNVPVEALWFFGWGLARHFVVALNIGTMGFWWWRMPEQISRYYESIEDLETHRPIAVERRPSLKIDWGVSAKLQVLSCQHAALVCWICPREWLVTVIL
jgi:hypothetical protein